MIYIHWLVSPPRGGLILEVAGWLLMRSLRARVHMAREVRSLDPEVMRPGGVLVNGVPARLAKNKERERGSNLYMYDLCLIKLTHVDK